MNDIDTQWEFVLHHSDEEIRRIAARASRERILRQLFPYPSMSNLHFSRKVTYPYDQMPYILTAVPRERYQVRDADDRPLSDGSLEEAVRELARVISASSES